VNRLLRAVFAFLILSASPVAAQVIHVVDDDGQGSAVDCNASAPAFTTVAAAIAASTNGDTVLVCAATYLENIDFDGKAKTSSHATASGTARAERVAAGSSSKAAAALSSAATSSRRT